MSDTFVVDLRHYLTPAGSIAEMPPRARLLAEYCASIVVDATSNLDGPPTVRCRRWTKNRSCTGIIMSFPAPDEPDSIYWHCPVCHDNGLIRGWRHTFWDGSNDDDAVHA
jgi:hypothetical protein